MEYFLSSFTNNIDNKGRVSVPASFRTIISSTESKNIVIYPSVHNSCLQGCSDKAFAQLVQRLEKMRDDVAEYDYFVTAILSRAVMLPMDSNGRIILSNKHLEYAAIDGQVQFVGKGKSFEIWDPGSFEKYLSDAEKIVGMKKELFRF